MVLGLMLNIQHMPSMINGISDDRSTSNARDAKDYQSSERLKEESLGIKQYTTDYDITIFLNEWANVKKIQSINVPFALLLVS